MEYVLHYDTSSNMGILYSYVCQRRRALRRIANFPGSQAVTHLRMPERIATRMMH